jgi:replicative DNA helicase
MDAVFSVAPGVNESAPRPRVTRLDALVPDLIVDAQTAHEAYLTGQPRGAVTGIASLDRELGGALSPGLHIAHGGPGVGKTAFALQAAALSGCPSLYISAEMGLLELLRRVIARTTSTYLGRLKSGELSPTDVLALAKRAVSEVPRLAFADATEAYADIDWVRSVAGEIRGEARHLLIVVDSIHSWVEAAPNEYGFAEYDRLSTGVAALRTLARQLDCAVIGIAERNRVSMTRGGVAASAGSRKFEYGCESLWELDADENATFDANGEKPITLKIAKNRNGSPNTTGLKLHFHGALQRFADASR